MISRRSPFSFKAVKSGLGSNIANQIPKYPITIQSVLVFCRAAIIDRTDMKRHQYWEAYMRWINSAGGPLMVLPEESLSNWGGCLEMGPTLTAESGDADSHETDYDRACKVNAYLALIHVGPEQGLVLGDEPMQTAWIPPVANQSGMLVRWLFARSEAELLAWLAVIPDGLFGSDIHFVVKNPQLFLFDSAVAGRNVKKKPDEFLPIDLEPGSYRIRTATYRPDEQTQMVVHRLERWSDPDTLKVR